MNQYQKVFSLSYAAGFFNSLYSGNWEKETMIMVISIVFKRISEAVC